MIAPSRSPLGVFLRSPLGVRGKQTEAPSVYPDSILFSTEGYLKACSRPSAGLTPYYLFEAGERESLFSGTEEGYGKILYEWTEIAGMETNYTGTWPVYRHIVLSLGTTGVVFGWLGELPLRLYAMIDVYGEDLLGFIRFRVRTLWQGQSLFSYSNWSDVPISEVVSDLVNSFAYTGYDQIDYGSYGSLDSISGVSVSIP